MGRSPNGLWNLVFREPQGPVFFSPWDLFILGSATQRASPEGGKTRCPFKPLEGQTAAMSELSDMLFSRWAGLTPPNCDARDPSRSGYAAPQKQAWVLRGQIMQEVLEVAGMLCWLFTLTSHGWPAPVVFRLRCVALASAYGGSRHSTHITGSQETIARQNNYWDGDYFFFCTRVGL